MSERQREKKCTGENACSKLDIERKNNDFHKNFYAMTPKYSSKGKCLGKDTPVLMFDGTTKMVQNIQEGELLMGDDSKPRIVLSTCKGEETMYIVNQKYGINYIVNESHILSLVLDKDPLVQENIDNKIFVVSWCSRKGYMSRRFEYKNVDKISILEQVERLYDLLPKKGDIIDICVLDYMKMTERQKRSLKGYKKDIEFEYKDIPVDPYIFGYLYGQQSLNSKLSLSSITQKLFDVYSNVNNLTDDSLKYVMESSYIPREYIVNNKNIRLSLLAGIADSIGNMIDNKYIEICHENEKVIKDLTYLCYSLGLFVSTLNSVNANGDNIFRMYISGNLECIPCIFFNLRGNNTTIISYDINIEKLNKDEYYGFEIDGNRRFLLGDFTVTHNTSIPKFPKTCDIKM